MVVLCGKGRMPSMQKKGHRRNGIVLITRLGKSSPTTLNSGIYTSLLLCNYSIPLPTYIYNMFGFGLV